MSGSNQENKGKMEDILVLLVWFPNFWNSSVKGLIQIMNCA